MKKINKKISGVISFLILIGLIILCLITNPTDGGPITIMLFLAVVFVFIFNILLFISNFLIEKTFGSIKITSNSRYYTSLIMASGLIYLLGLQTIGQLQPLDIILVLLFEMLANFYILRRL